MKRFGLLRARDIECRISQADAKRGVDILLYKTARTDANALDAVVGPESWACDFRQVGDVLYGGIGIRFGTEWVWKWDAGSESNIEAEKGEASDAFKRAGFKWGIGRELYSSPRIHFRPSECRFSESGRCYDSFVVDAIEYDADENISKLCVRDVSTGKAFTWTAEKPAEPDAPKKISTEQRRQIFDAAKATYGDSAPEYVTKVISAKGYEFTRDILESDFQDILQALAPSA